MVADSLRVVCAKGIKLFRQGGMIVEEPRKGLFYKFISYYEERFFNIGLSLVAEPWNDFWAYYLCVSLGYWQFAIGVGI